VGDNIKMDLGKIRCVGMDWIDLARDRDQWKALVNICIPYNVGKFLGSYTTGSLSRTQLDELCT
jgi:hypothetical protein